MLSYQHIYHAGNAADVHKHAALCVVLKHLTQKEKPLTYIETHAGRGVYDLACAEAMKTGEAAKGYLKLSKNKRLQDHPYFELQRRIQTEVGKNLYAGSPFIAEALLRPTDTLHLMELHPQEYQALYGLMRYPNTHLHHRDGYEGGLALCPPHPRRGILVIDPSYEVKTEYDKVADFLLKLHKKWAEGVLFLWYPVLKENLHLPMLAKLKEADLPKFYQSEILFPDTREGMLGSGIVIINAPYQSEEELNRITGWFS
ncbi:MAG: 23S rRNA (adenine(2030)-N(6))-methyltransferase RlmJ [Alphaproteobacteria bacterium]|nr:23S rRNA (adenine(2030)-N(6))-methyltransferase RlmJ [Alphaproteobacteria bacterium]